MKLSRRHTTQILATALVAAATACSDDALAPSWELEEVSQAHRVTVIEDSSALGARLRHMDLDLTLVGDPVGAMLAPAAAPNPVHLAQIAELSAPEVDGVILQATHVDLAGDLAFVGYGLQGARARGAVDVIADIRTASPRLASSALFKDTEANALLVHDGLVYLATAVEEGAWNGTAAIEVARLRAESAFAGFGKRVAVPSFAATGIALAGDRLYAVSGDIGGGLSILHTRSMKTLRFDAFDDARSVTVQRNLAVVLRGSPGELRVYQVGSDLLLRTIDLGTDLTRHAKAGLDIAGDVAAVAVGRDGIKLVHLRSGTVIGELGFPELTGVAEEDVVANEVAIYEDLLFVAAGGAGLRVARASRDLGALGANDDPDLQWVGTVDFGDRASVNFVAHHRDRLFVAGGSGGLRVVVFKD